MAVKDLIDNVASGLQMPGRNQQGEQKPQVFGNALGNAVVTHAADSQTMGGSSTTTALQESPAAAGAEPQNKRRSYVQIIQDLMPEWDPEKMKAQIEADKKREKRQALFAAIGDGISALTNLHFASKGAPNMFDASKGMTAAHTAYWDKVKTEREKNRQSYLNAYLSAAGMDEESEHKSWLRSNTEKQQEFENDLKTKQEARTAELHVLDMELRRLQNQLQRGQITAQEYANQVAAAKAKYAEQAAELEIEQTKASIANTKASAAAHYASAESSRANAEATRIGAKIKQDEQYTTFSCGSYGQYKVPNSALHTAEITRLYGMLTNPKAIDEDTRRGVTTDNMLKEIGREAESNAKIREELKRISIRETADL